MPIETIPEIAYLIIDAVAAVYHRKVEEIFSHSRQAAIVAPRNIIMYLLHEKVKLSYLKIGHLLGGRDHSTVIHDVRKVERFIREDGDYRDCVAAFVLMLRLEDQSNVSTKVSQ